MNASPQRPEPLDIVGAGRTHPKFSSYEMSEVEQVARKFVAHVRRIAVTPTYKEPGSVAWTEVIIDYFCNTRPRGVVVDARLSRRKPSEPGALGRGDIQLDPNLSSLAGKPRDTGGEWLFDLCHATYPSYGARSKYGKAQYWKDAFSAETPPRLKLVLESEWGKLASKDLSVHRVFEDACKLLHVCAAVKVVVFASHDKPNQIETVDLAWAMVQRDETTYFAGKRQLPTSHERPRRPTWLWIDIPWRWDEQKPEAWIFTPAGGALSAPGT